MTTHADLINKRWWIGADQTVTITLTNAGGVATGATVSGQLVDAADTAIGDAFDIPETATPGTYAATLIAATADLMAAGYVYAVVATVTHDGYTLEHRREAIAKHPGT